MPCTKCRSDFNLLNWKIKCGECHDKYCSKCLRRNDGVFYCEKCLTLLTRPPDRVKLMNLKSKDIQDYLAKNNISTHGLVEKHELVDLLCNRHIPVKQKKTTEKLMANFAGSVPNLRAPDALNDLISGIESMFPSGNGSTSNTPVNQPNRSSTSENSSPQPTSPIKPQQQSPAQHQEQESQPQPTTSSDNKSVESTPSAQTKFPKLSDFKSIEELNELSVKELKVLLTLNRMDYKGCVEKTELLERIERLWNDNNKKNNEVVETFDDLCKLCMDAPLDCVLLECGHIATCLNCGKILSECPICRQYVVRVVRTFKA